MRPSETPPTSDKVCRAGKYLTFRLEDEIYGIEILAVHEIISRVPVTSVPRTPEFVRGVINLRGRIIPVVDVARLFGLAPKDDTPRTCIIVVQPGGARSSVGLIVEEVCEVIDVTADQFVDAPDLVTEGGTGYVVGIAEVAESVTILLDMSAVLSAGTVVSLFEESERAESAEACLETR